MKEKISKNIIFLGLFIFLGFVCSVETTFAADAFKLTEPTFSKGVEEFSGRMKDILLLLLGVGLSVALYHGFTNPARGAVIFIVLIVMYFTATKMIF